MNPIKCRIIAAFGHENRMEYTALMRAVFPESEYPNAMRYQSNGGPPGCAMAFGRALRSLGCHATGVGAGRIVQLPLRARIQP